MISLVGNQQPTLLLLNINEQNMNYSDLGPRPRLRGVVVQHAVPILQERPSQSGGWFQRRGERPAGGSAPRSSVLPGTRRSPVLPSSFQVTSFHGGGRRVRGRLADRNISIPDAERYGKQRSSAR